MNQTEARALATPVKYWIGNQLIANGTLVKKDGFYELTKDTEFSSPSASRSSD